MSDSSAAQLPVITLFDTLTGKKQDLNQYQEGPAPVQKNDTYQAPTPTAGTWGSSCSQDLVIPLNEKEEITL